VMLVSFRPLELWKLSNGNKLYSYAKQYDKTEWQVAIRWLTSQKNVVTIFGSQNNDHIIENLWAEGWNMPEADIESLRENYKGQIFISDCVALA
jgi:diketogulonate reductase-like aldo/keto reductase